MLDRLDHLVVGVRDLDAAADSYTRLLGRRLSWRGRHPSMGTANVIFRLGNTYLELLGVDGEGPVASLLGEQLGREGEGLVALAFGTPDADACARELRRRGLPAPDPVDHSGVETTSGVERRWRNVFLDPGDTRGVRIFAIEHRSPADALPPARPTSGEASAVSGIDHVVVMTPDADAAIALYRDRLGIRLALDRTFEAWGMRLVFFRIGGVTVEIAHPLAGGGSGGDRLWGISWQVPDVEAARARVAAAGFDVSETRTGRRPGTRVCTVRDGTHGVATLLLGPG